MYGKIYIYTYIIEENVYDSFSDGDDDDDTTTNDVDFE